MKLRNIILATAIGLGLACSTSTPNKNLRKDFDNDGQTDTTYLDCHRYRSTGRNYIEMTHCSLGIKYHDGTKINLLRKITGNVKLQAYDHDGDGDLDLSVQSRSSGYNCKGTENHIYLNLGNRIWKKK